MAQVDHFRATLDLWSLVNRPIRVSGVSLRGAALLVESDASGTRNGTFDEGEREKETEGTLPEEWLLKLAGCLRETFGTAPSLNDPFRGGHIVRSHAGELPWVQIEVSRAPTHSLPEKRERVLEAFRRFCSRL